MLPPEVNPRDWKAIGPYAIVSLAAFVAGMALLVGILSHAERFAALGLTGSLYYVVLLPLSLCAAAFLFGILRSYASYRGEHFGGVLQLGGPILAAALVMVGGFALPPNQSTFPLTVYVQDPEGEPILHNSDPDSVYMDLGANRERKAIDENGQAFFPAIPAVFRGQLVHVWLDSKQYDPTSTDQLYRLSKDALYLPVRRREGKIVGHLYDGRGNPLVGARVEAAGLVARTDSVGYFELIIPGNRANREMELTASAPGHDAKHFTAVLGGSALAISLD
jgi:hypothetical protein